MRYPRPVKRWQRPVVRIAQPLRFQRPVKRWPRVMRKNEFVPLYKLKKKPRDEYPELYKELQDLKELFVKKGRKTGIHCLYSSDHHISGLEICICRCKRKCEALTIRNIAGPGEVLTDVLDDFIKYQRLCNIIYGTVREKDLQTK